MPSILVTVTALLLTLVFPAAAQISDDCLTSAPLGHIEGFS